MGTSHKERHSVEAHQNRLKQYIIIIAITIIIMKTIKIKE